MPDWFLAPSDKMKFLFAAVFMLWLLHCATAEQMSVPAVSNGELCETCKYIVSNAENYVASPKTQQSMINFMINKVCPDLPESLQLQCDTLSAVLVPQFARFINVTFDPASTCADMGVCIPNTTLQASSNNMVCPFCKIMVNGFVQSVESPQHVQALRSEVKKVCELVAPEDGLKCEQTVDSIIDQIEDVVARIDAGVTCNQAGLCSDVARLPFLFHARQAGLNVASTDFCEVCQIVVMEAAALLSDPKTQAAITAMAKSACELVPTFQDECNTEVDMYAPMVYNLLLMYLKPKPMCSSMGMCEADAIFEGTLIVQQ